MTQIFHHYTKWEDWNAGMYRYISLDERDHYIQQSMKVRGNINACKDAMNMVVENWAISCEVNLTNPNNNPKAWLGQAACCIYGGSPEDCTREAWMRLTDTQRRLANLAAEQIINDWLITNNKKQRDAQIAIRF